MAAPSKNCLKKFLLHFVNEHIDFRLPELRSLANIVGSKIVINDDTDTQKCPFVVVEMASEAVAQNIVHKSVLVRCLYELWGSATTHAELYKNLVNLPKSFTNGFRSSVASTHLEHDQKDATSPRLPVPMGPGQAVHGGLEKSFRVCVETFNKSLSMAERVKRIQGMPLDELGFTGRVNLTNPDTSLHLCEYYGPSGTLQHVYLGRWGYGFNSLIAKDVSIRHEKMQVIILAGSQRVNSVFNSGHTSMDTCLSLLMANIAQVTANSLVYDPFVGTGSLSVACAHSGAYVMGADIDYMIMHGKGRSSRHDQTMRGPDENIRANLQQYGLQANYVDVVVADASLHKMLRREGLFDAIVTDLNLQQYGLQANYVDVVVADASLHRLLRREGLFDAIVTDPPYGVRAAAKKISSQKSQSIEEDMEGLHIPKRVNYQLSDIFLDLLNFAARFLTLNGHLVYWLPVYRSEYTEENIPTHPCLTLQSNSEQVLSMKISRRLICMRKTTNFQELSENGATISKDHYSDSTFRSKYFTSRFTQQTDEEKSTQESDKVENYGQMYDTVNEFGQESRNSIHKSAQECEIVQNSAK